jgi:hypothetical protein
VGYLKCASLGSALALPANRLGWKGLPGTNAILRTLVNYYSKIFITSGLGEANEKPVPEQLFRLRQDESSRRPQEVRPWGLFHPANSLADTRNLRLILLSKI